MKKKTELVKDKSYFELLEKIKLDIQQAQLKAALSVTQELTNLYWQIGRYLSEVVSKEKWGAKAIERIAKDLELSFPGVSGFSFRNLKFMRQFAECYAEGVRETAVSLIPWGHNIVLMQKVDLPKKRFWYAQQAIQNGWSRSVLGMWIESDLYERQGKSVSNFKETLPNFQSDLAEQTLKDPYNFSFLALDKKFREHELEQGLMDHLQKFLLELGQGFAFVGRQVKLSIGKKDYYIDLLFYHTKLRCYIVIELKADEFDPRDAGQINFYLSAVDDNLRHKEDRPTIGMLLCKTKDNFTVEYALRDIKKPIGVSGYEVKLLESLPKEYKGSLPTVEEIERELAQDQV